MLQVTGTKYVCRHCLAITTVYYNDAMAFLYSDTDAWKDREIRELLPEEEENEDTFFVYEAGYCDACFEGHHDDPNRVITPTKVFEVRDEVQHVHERFKRDMDALIEKHLDTVIASLNAEQIDKILKHPLRPKRQRKQLSDKSDKFAAHIARQLFEIDEIANFAEAYRKETESEIAWLKATLGEEGIDHYYSHYTDEIGPYSTLIDPIPVKGTPRLHYHIETILLPSQILGGLTLTHEDYRYSLDTDALIDTLLAHIKTLPTGEINET